MRNACIRGFCCAAVLGLAAGCGGPASTSATDEGRKVIRVITGAADRAGVPSVLAEYFAPGSAPSGAELKSYGRYDFEPIGEPEFAADGCTIKVKVIDTRSSETRELDWTLAKEGETWRLKSAPLK